MNFDILMGVVKTVNLTSLKVHSREFIPLPTASGNWWIQLKTIIVREYVTEKAVGKKISLKRILHFYEIFEITARSIFKGFWRTPVKIFCNLCGFASAKFQVLTINTGEVIRLNRLPPLIKQAIFLVKSSSNSPKIVLNANISFFSVAAMFLMPTIIAYSG